MYMHMYNPQMSYANSVRPVTITIRSWSWRMRTLSPLHLPSQPELPPLNLQVCSYTHVNKDMCVSTVTHGRSLI